MLIVVLPNEVTKQMKGSHIHKFHLEERSKTILLSLTLKEFLQLEIYFLPQKAAQFSNKYHGTTKFYNKIKEYMETIILAVIFCFRGLVLIA